MRGPLLAAVFLLGGPAYGRCAELLSSIVRSDKLDIRRKDGRQLEEFTGNVSFERGDKRLRAGWALYDHGARTLDARHGIAGEWFPPAGGRLEILGYTARHDQQSRSGELQGEGPDGRVSLTRFAADGKVAGKGGARRLRWEEDGGRLWLQDQARLEDERGEVSAGSILYDRDRRSVLLEGRKPVVTARETGWTAAVQAERIEGFACAEEIAPGELCPREERRLSASGGVSGWLRFSSRPKGLP